MSSEPDRVVRPDPPWQRDAWQAITGELHEFVTTAWAVTRAPRRFAAGFSDGTLRTLNPLMFVLNGLAALGTWNLVWKHALGLTTPDAAIWIELTRPVWPLLVTLGWTALAHVVIRMLGGTRPLRSSLAMVFFTGGGPLVLVSMVLSPPMLLMTAPPLTIAHGVGGLSIALALVAATIAYPTLALAGVHRVAWWRVALGVSVATIVELTFVIWTALHHKSWLPLLGG